MKKVSVQSRPSRRPVARAASAPITEGNYDDHEFHAFLQRVNARFARNTKNGDLPVFTTKVSDLFGVYLDTFPTKKVRQYHTCNCCRRFIEKFGGLVTIDENGRTKSAVWDVEDAPDAYRDAVAAMARASVRAPVRGVFLSEEFTWGTPQTGVWHHFFVTPPASMVYRRTLLTAGQAMAERLEDFKNVTRALHDFTSPMLEEAVRVLQSDALYRSEKVLGPAEWLRTLRQDVDNAPSSLRANITWRAIAKAPAGFCHPRSSMIGTLLEDIAAGMTFDAVSRRFAEKMHPLRYQRPTEPPKAGAIVVAEKVVEKLNAAGSLARRFARFDDIAEHVWTPRSETIPPSGKGVFANVRARGSMQPSGLTLPPQVMTWVKFTRDVLPGVERLEILAPGSGNYAALVTAVHPDAPPILQWDLPDRRNPVSWYLWHGGSSATQWGLEAGVYHNVTSVTLKPSMWHGAEMEHQGRGALFVIEGARESRMPGLALFPEILKSEFHSVRSVIEAHSRQGRLEDAEQQSAAGLLFGSREGSVTLRTHTKGQSSTITLDRWE